MFKVAWTSLADSARMRNKKADRDKLQDRLDYLFPVTSCPHKVCSCTEDGCEGCEAEAHMLNCNCKREKKLPVIELKFMLAMQAHRPGKASMKGEFCQKGASTWQWTRRKSTGQGRRL